MIYVHVPFCRSFCTYCGFYSEACPIRRSGEAILRQENMFSGYADALEAEIRTRHDEIERVFASSDVNTLYIGGGTPSVLPLSVFERMLKALGHDGFREFTVEVNPEDIVDKGEAYVRGLLDLGVNRISMGVQSFDDPLLKWMNRRHTSSQAVEAYHILEGAGVENISIDLIFGLPQLTDGLWRETLDKALNISSCGIQPKHISAYQLSVEEDSMLEKMIARGMCQEASEEDCQRQYSVLCEVLGAAGYHHYEVSNFAKPGFEAVHNSAYWRHIPYVGLGPGAHSYMHKTFSESESIDARCVEMAFPHPRVGGGAQLCWEGAFGIHWRDACLVGKRQWNKNNLNGYIEAGKTGDFSSVQDGEMLDASQMTLERIMLGLRTSSGVPESFLREHCRPKTVDEAVGSGSLVATRGGNLRIPEERFFISDNIISSLI